MMGDYVPLDAGGAVTNPAPHDAQLIAAAAEFKPTPDSDEVVDRINAEFAAVIAGDTFLILRERAVPGGRRIVEFLRPEAFRAWFQNTAIEVVDWKGNAKCLSWARLWLASPRRRQYDGLAFAPQGAPDGIYNLWRGFDVEAAPLECGYPLFAEHLERNVCGGDLKLYRWVLAWFAHMVQRPEIRLGIALVLRGRQGAGKTIVGVIFGRLVAAHYALADDARYLTGQFNAHMASCLLLQLDEGFWAGDKAAEGRLKGLITSDTQFIERKGVDPIRMPNLVRLLITSNHDWVVPAGFEERRFAVLDVGDGNMQDHKFFAAMMAEMEAGGYQALLHDLLNFDLDSMDLRKVPSTAALFEQKIASMPPEASWWFECLNNGYISDPAADWEEPISKAAVYASYRHAVEARGIRRKESPTALGMMMSKSLCPDVDNQCKAMEDYRHDDGSESPRRVNGYRFPPLANCRRAFEERIGWPIEWEGDD